MKYVNLINIYQAANFIVFYWGENNAKLGPIQEDNITLCLPLAIEVLPDLAFSKVWFTSSVKFENCKNIAFDIILGYKLKSKENEKYQQQKFSLQKLKSTFP